MRMQIPGLLPPLNRLAPSSRCRLDSMLSVFRRLDGTRMTAPNRPVPCVSRFRGGSSMFTSSRVKDEELGEQYSTQYVGNGYDRQTIKEFVAHPANEEVSRWKNVNVTYGDKCRCMITTYPRTSSEPNILMEIKDGNALCGDGHPSNYNDTIRAETDIDGIEDKMGETATGYSEEDEDWDSEEDEDWAAAEDAVPLYDLDNSSHRDGLIYKVNTEWKEEYCITDRNETRFGPMMLTELKNGVVQWPDVYLQLFSIKLAKIPRDCVSVELYGYIAARDCVDPLLNYIVNISRDNPIIVEQGSLIEMTGPKRGINFSGYILLEYDMRIKRGDQARDDLQLIDGATDLLNTISPNRVFTNRLRGDNGAVDITRALVGLAVEATVDILVSEVHTSFNLSLSSFLSRLQEVHLFRGAVGESRELRRRFVIAVLLDTQMHLKFMVGVGRDTAEHSCFFEANTHGCSSQQMRIEFASISVTVTWST